MHVFNNSIFFLHNCYIVLRCCLLRCKTYSMHILHNHLFFAAFNARCLLIRVPFPTKAFSFSRIAPFKCRYDEIHLSCSKFDCQQKMQWMTIKNQMDFTNMQDDNMKFQTLYFKILSKTLVYARWQHLWTYSKMPLMHVIANNQATTFIYLVYYVSST